jgi:membrane-associated phospholipid phosphatase
MGMAGSNEGNEGNEGNFGNFGRSGRGGGGDGGVSVLPDRVDLPFVTMRAAEPGGAGGREPIDQQTTSGLTWKDRHWDGRWAAWLTLADFASHNKLAGMPGAPADAINVITLQVAQQRAGVASVDDELRRLVKMATDERADALGEIVAQYEGFVDYFMAAMTISPRSHPATCQLLHVGSLVGAYVSMYFKGQVARIRPSQLLPALLPPVPVPGHPSFPSGHATQAHLMQLCVAGLMPRSKVAATAALAPDPDLALVALADRIAQNREIAGLHYPSDTAAGGALADTIWAKLSAVPRVVTLRDNAVKEWQ